MHFPKALRPFRDCWLLRSGLRRGMTLQIARRASVRQPRVAAERSGAATLGYGVACPLNPERVPYRRTALMQSLRAKRVVSHRLPRVAAARQPGAILHNPFRIASLGSVEISVLQRVATAPSQRDGMTLPRRLGIIPFRSLWMASRELANACHARSRAFPPQAVLGPCFSTGRRSPFPFPVVTPVHGRPAGRVYSL
jgi:hypothetical protein